MSHRILSIKTCARNIFLALIYSLLCGCPMVGPDFQKPAPPNTNRYVALPLPNHTAATPGLGNAGASQHFVSGADIPAQWWRVFHSKDINRLICQAFANSPTVASAMATLKQAQQSLIAQTGSLYPSIDGLSSAQRQASSGDIIGIPGTNIFNLYNVGANVSYNLDLFGGLHRQVEAYAAQVDYQRYQLEAAYLTLSSNIVTTAVNIASLRAQIAATQDLIHEEESQLVIVKKQLKLGGASETNVLAQETQVAQTRALLPPLEQSLAIAHHSLAVLVGKLPSKMKVPQFDLNQFTLPTNLPINVPSGLVQQRPDIQAAEALLKVASAQIGVATANMLPQITLSGNIGWTSLQIDQLFAPGHNIWGFGGQLLQPIFQGGTLVANQRAAIDAFQAAAAQYRQTVLQAFQNVADSLRAIENDAKNLQAQRLAEVAALNTLQITAKQLQLGGVSYLNLLSAQQQYQQAKINRIQAEAARFADTAALFQALGGGWWNRSKELPIPAETQKQRQQR